MELSIILLNYNTPEYTLNCIKSLYNQHKNEIEQNRYEIILADNKSTDDSVKKLQNEIKKQKWKLLFIESDKNTGFGGGCNMAVKKAKGKYLLLLNNDTLVKDDSITRLLKFLYKHKYISILGGGLLNDDGSKQGASGIFPNLFHSFMILAGLGKNILVRNTDVINEVDWVTGGCMLMSKKTFDELNGFDTNIFMYFEDLELCYRAKRANKKIYQFPKINILHMLGKSSTSSFKIIHSYKGYLYFIKKHKNKLEYMLINSLFRLKFKTYHLYGKLSNNSFFINTYSQI